jgi:protein-L-isoaspartate(D-aspartate) O-methyltransferase
MGPHSRRTMMLAVSHDALVAQLVASQALVTPRIIDAFRAVDRADFVPPESSAQAYEDWPLRLAAGATISQPTTVAVMFELLQPGEGDTILDVGSGSGWTSALLAACVGPTGFVTGTEIIPELVEVGQQHLAKSHVTNAVIRLAEDQPGIPGKHFERILVSAAAREIPTVLLEQLVPGGTMVIPVQTSLQKITWISRDDIRTATFPGFFFVPLR